MRIYDPYNLYPEKTKLGVIMVGAVKGFLSKSLIMNIATGQHKPTKHNTEHKKQQEVRH